MDMVASYSILLERVSRFLFGIRSGFSEDQIKDIEDCIGDGLRRVYAAHDWSFFRPVKAIKTTANVSEYDLPPGFDSIQGEMQYPLSEDTFYPPLRERSDSQIRRWQQADDSTGRPLFFSVRTTEFDPAVGSRKKLVLYPTPDDTYTIKARMTLRSIPIDSVNQYPIGGETLAPVIMEACMAAGEHNYDDGEGIHEKRFLELLPMAIREDQEKSTPTVLGPDGTRTEWGGMSYDQWRASQIGDLTLDGEIL